MEFIPLAKPDINEEDIALVNKVLRSGMLVQGEYVAKLEADFCRVNSSSHAIALSNGTATLHLALTVLGIGPGDEVIVPAFSYVATANVVELVGATPVFVDTEPDTFNIDASLIEQAITPRTRAIIPVHEFGLSCDMTAVMEIADRHQLKVIEDAACALGATQNGKHTGTWGHLGSFSLHPRKSITSGEGGVLLTADAALAQQLRVLRNHGIDLSSGRMDFVEAGYNYRMTDFQAALAYSQLQRLEQILAYKNKLAAVYFDTISHPDIVLPSIPGGMEHTWQTYHILLPDGMDQYAVIARLKEQGIGVNYGAQCIPAQTYYVRKYALDVEKLFPNALRAFSKGIALPVYEKLSEQQIQHISNVINKL